MSKQPLYKGTTGKSIFIDLTEQRFCISDLDRDIAKEYIGGRGIGAAYLFRHFKNLADKYENPFKDAAPFSADNALIFSTSPCTGTMMPMSSRVNINFKSPLTEGLGSFNAGSDFGGALKKAGFDLLSITGKADAPLYITIDFRGAKFYDAKFLKDLDSIEARAAIKKEHNKEASILTIGEAGRNLVKFATVTASIGDSFGRGGAGAVMGSKNLYAIAALPQKDANIEPAEPEKFELSDKNSPAFKLKMKIELGKLTRKEQQYGVLSCMGTAGLVGLIYANDRLSHKNMRDTKHDSENIRKISGEALRCSQKDKKGEGAGASIKIEKVACLNCEVGCKRKNTVIDNKTGEIIDHGWGPKLDTIASIGANLDIYDIIAVTRAGNLLDRYGMDHISFGATIGAFFELYEYVSAKKSGLTEKEEMFLEDVKDFKAKYGEPKFAASNLVLPLVHTVGLKQGIGKYLAMGSYCFCKRYGHIEFSMTVKKMELPYYDPRASFAQGLCYEVSNRGGCCQESGYIALKELCAGYGQRDGNQIEGTALIAKNASVGAAVCDIIGACPLGSFSISLDEYASITAAAAGVSITAGDLCAAAQKTILKEREFNEKCGFTKGDDCLPKRFFCEQIEVLGQKVCCKKEDFEKMRLEYYQAMGWK